MTKPKPWGKNIKGIIYKKIPLSNKNKKKVKKWYYDFYAWPIFKIKNKFQYGNPDIFSAVNIETTTHCNYRCKWCPNSKYGRGLLKNKKLLPTETYKKIIDELKEINYSGMISPFFYGEPLTDKRLPELIEYTKKNLPKAKIYVNTNGSLMTIPIYKKWIKSGVDVFAISQYTPKMLPNIKEILEYLRKHPEIPNKIQYRVFTEDLATSNRGGEIEIKKIADRPLCQYPGHYDISINYNGDVVLCCVDYHGQHVFGNVKKERLIDIWKKPNFVKIRKDVLKGKFKLPICKKCVGLE